MLVTVLQGVKCFINGRIYAGFKPLRVREAVVAAYGRILYVGENEDALSICRMLKGEIVDLGERIILPGFIDSHMHLDSLGLQLATLDLRGVRSIDELKKRIREYNEEKNPGIIIGRGWDQELFDEKRWPTRWDIDEVIGDKPVILIRVCGHAAVLNTKAMGITGLLTKQTSNIVRDESGVATGIVVEDAVGEALSILNGSMSMDARVGLMESALKYASSLGVTTIGFMSCGRYSLEALFTLFQSNGWRYPRIRVYMEPGLFNDVSRLGVKGGFGNEYLRIKGVKLFADGSLGARTAWLSKPYSDKPSVSGRQLISKEELREVLEKASKQGFQVAVHGIGDAAIDLILSVYRELGVSGRIRHRIEHASVIRPDQIEEASRLGIVISVQPHFVISDWWAKERLGSERIKWLYPFKTMTSKGVMLGFSTDSPVEPLNPWETIYAAVTRGRNENIFFYEDTRNEALTLEDALYYYTYGSAYVIGEEEELGSLEEGKLADFIVVDRDPFEVDIDEVRGIKVLETYIGGERIY
ncbi:amidohydrolase [Desulfurococcus amylolyticus]|uniref:amidohydrolase n=1 Tax=Desulfurococcus amylolyticus TaxID=94694 RepID=UPI0005B1DDC2